MRQRALDRRTLLRGAIGGAAVSVGLPPLAAMLDAGGTAHADGTAIPRRFGSWFWGNGVVQKHWKPATTGRGWAVPPSLKPFADAGVIDQVSIITDTNVPITRFWAHHSHYKTMLAAATPIYDDKGFPRNFGGPTFYETIRKALGGSTRLDGVEAEVSRQRGTPVGYLMKPTLSKHNPSLLFDQLFAGFTPPAAGASPTPMPSAWATDLRRSVLDLVRADAQDLRALLGAADRARLDDHLESVRGAERSLLAVRTAEAPAGPGCRVPARPGAMPPDVGMVEPLAEVSEAFSSLLAYALACDITRTFSFTFVGPQSNAQFPQFGLTMALHEWGHKERPDDDPPKIQQVVVFIMTQLARLAGKLAAIPVGAGTLLDHCCILGVSEQQGANQHSGSNIPTLLVGRAGGGLRGGVHVRLSGDRLHSRVPLTAMRALGLDLATFGSGPNQATAPIPELLA